MDHSAFKLSRRIPVDRLRLHNQLPPERDALVGLLKEARQKRKALDLELRKISAQRDDLESYIDALAEVLAPCRMVPAEVWSAVFGYIPESCWEISWVCRGWRQIALSTPVLWTEIPKPGYLTPHPAKFLSRLRSAIHRAGNKPLRISKLRLPLKLGCRAIDLERFFTLFHAIIPRIGDLSLEVDVEHLDTAFSFLAEAPQRFDELKSVKVYTRRLSRPWDPIPAPPNVELFTFSPKLSSLDLSLESAGYPPLTKWLKVPWANFSTLSLMWITPGDLYHILKHAPRLEVFNIFSTKTTTPQNGDQRLQQPIQHSKLRKLSWVSFNTVYMDVFPLLYLPNIEELFLHLKRWHEFVESEAVPAFSPAPQFPHLIRLFIGPHWHDNYDGEGLVSLLRVMPALETLWLSWTSDIDIVFDALAAPNTGGFLLPSLSLLRIFNIPEEELTGPGCFTWHVALNELAMIRGARADWPSQDGGLMVVLSGIGLFTAKMISKVSKALLFCLNCDAQGHRGHAPGDKATPEASGEDVLHRIAKIVRQLTAPSTSTRKDDVKYVSARVKLRSKLREALKELLSDERKFHLYAEPMLANLDAFDETPTELQDLTKPLLPEGADPLISRLLEK